MDGPDALSYKIRGGIVRWVVLLPRSATNRTVENKVDVRIIRERLVELERACMRRETRAAISESAIAAVFVVRVRQGNYGL